VKIVPQLQKGFTLGLGSSELSKG